MKDSATITLVQLQAAKAQSPAMDRIPVFFEQAASLGSDLIVFPEYVLGDLITTAHENAPALSKRLSPFATSALGFSVAERLSRRVVGLGRPRLRPGVGVKCDVFPVLR